MSNNGLDRQSDIEELLAWLDGELSGPEAQRVADLVAADRAWRESARQFGAVAQLASLLEPAKPQRALTDRIVRSAYRRKWLTRAAQIVAPLAAAACIILAIRLGSPTARLKTNAPPPPPAAAVGVEAKIAAILKDVPAKDRFIVQNLSLFRHYDEVGQYQQVRDLADAETLSALAEIENAGNM